MRPRRSANQPKKMPPTAAADEGCGHHGAGEGGGEMQVALDGGEDHRVEHDVHAVEHPAEGGGDEGSALRRRCGRLART